ncbi:MAG TPA: hypothetical protein VED01_24000 [Burkholderiales bacterium]|nr:hypothetical protein [Burkholderiales bacterium]
MTTTRVLIVMFLLALSGTAAAHGVRFGIGIGFPIFPPAYYYPPPAYYYPPPVVVAPSPPPVYVERSDQAAAPPPEHYWYYCADSQAYYPYVKQCASTWQRVTPTPPGAQ